MPRALASAWRQLPPLMASACAALAADCAFASNVGEVPEAEELDWPAVACHIKSAISL